MKHRIIARYNQIWVQEMQNSYSYIGGHTWETWVDIYCAKSIGKAREWITKRVANEAERKRISKIIVLENYENGVLDA